jgi:hypothetical protein
VCNNNIEVNVEFGDGNFPANELHGNLSLTRSRTN